MLVCAIHTYYIGILNILYALYVWMCGGRTYLAHDTHRFRLRLEWIIWNK